MAPFTIVTGMVAVAGVTTSVPSASGSASFVPPLVPLVPLVPKSPEDEAPTDPSSPEGWVKVESSVSLPQPAWTAPTEMARTTATANHLRHARGEEDLFMPGNRALAFSATQRLPA